MNIGVFLEDAAALTGITLAATGMGLASYLHLPFFDALGTVAVGTMLVCHIFCRVYRVYPDLMRADNICAILVHGWCYLHCFLYSWANATGGLRHKVHPHMLIPRVASRPSLSGGIQTF